MALGKEQIKIVSVSRSQSQRVEVYQCTLSSMHATQVDRQLIVQEHPNVVVTCKAKRLPCLIGERCMQLSGEAEIVPLPLITQKLIVDREEAGVVVCVNARAGISEGQADSRSLIDTCSIVKPLTKILCRCERSKCRNCIGAIERRVGSRRVDWGAIASQCCLYDAMRIT